MFNFRKKSLAKLDTILVFCISILIAFGFVVLYSAVYNLTNVGLKSQIIATLLGFFVMVFIALMDSDFIKSIAIPIYMVSIVLLLLTLIFGVGAEQWGSDSWLSIGGFTFQPAEFVKIGVIIAFARMLEQNEKTLNAPKTLIKVLVVGLIPVALIVLQPDIGTALVFVFFLAVMLFAANLQWRYFIGALLAGLATLPFIFLNMGEFRINRILNFFDPSRDTSGSGYQALQGRIAIGSGRFLGRGLLQGTQTQYGFIPERETDFIFAVIGEEFGFLGGFLVIMLYAVMLMRLIFIAKKAPDAFGRYLTMGLAAMFLFHIFENIGMTIGVMPITGIPLPFFSYGGTFQLSNLIAVGLILCVNLQKSPLDFAPSRYRFLRRRKSF